MLARTNEISVDVFCGGGGYSTGFEMATGRSPDIAVNHDWVAIAIHMMNHPETLHYKKDVYEVSPKEACKGRPVGSAHFSPDCTHFSAARGGKPRSKDIRALPEVAVTWAREVRPRVITMENVKEIVSWGPLDDNGKIIKEKVGTLFNKMVADLQALGYVVEWRILVMCDYGSPTSRERFFLIARCDGLPIVWPEATHGHPDSYEVKCGLKKAWRTASEIIDWSIACPSIFLSTQEIKAKYGRSAKRPLEEKTMKRIAKGIQKFVISNPDPFIVHYKFENEPESIKKPISTITAVNGHYLAMPTLIQYHDGEEARGQKLTDPIMTLDTSNRYALTMAHLTEYYGNAQDALSLSEPLHTVTARDREALTLAHVIKFKGDNVGHPADAPLQTLTAGGGEFGTVQTTIVKAGNGADLMNWPKIRALLNKHCGYSLGDNDILLLWIHGAAYFLADIGLRMLIPRELYRGMGFPDTYIIDRYPSGKPIPAKEQVAKAGNAVCPQMAAALVRANVPEMCKENVA